MLHPAVRPSLLALAGLALVALLAGCERFANASPPAASPAPPPPELARRAVLALLPGLQFGPDPAQDAYREIRAVEVAGSHFVPATDRWTVHYCVEFVTPASDAPASRCDMSLELYRLDTGKWVGLARGAGTLYRWQVLDDAPPSGAPESSPAEAPAQSGARP
jgi:hypothetical protein